MKILKCWNWQSLGVQKTACLTIDGNSGFTKQLDYKCMLPAFFPSSVRRKTTYVCGTVSARGDWSAYKTCFAPIEHMHRVQAFAKTSGSLMWQAFSRDICCVLYTGMYQCTDFINCILFSVFFINSPSL